ncbi:MAG: hypothetical protein IJE29_03255 [Firmicutes bacterium]|nr:hypothetical protein [Bacillota bacterium]MBQ3199044.1 hypothetical protein [Bacillota bacterium]MBQ3200279.1 hypothetical protein [Bacillota bacterium]
MLDKFKKIWDFFTTLLVVIVVILAIALAGVRLVGFQVFSVLSGSMEPTYHVGSLIYVKNVDYTELQGCTKLAEGETVPQGAASFESGGQVYLADGDVITFMLDENTVATHRVVEVVPDDENPEVLRYRTKGDANNAVDGGLVHYKNVIGSPVFTIPQLGYLANYVQNPPGMYVAISAGAVLMLLILLPDLFGSDEENKKTKKGRRGKEDGTAAEAQEEAQTEAKGE